MATYTDLNASYTPRNTKTSPTAKNMEDIKRSLLRLFTTPKGSVPFNRNYGSGLYEMLFENELNLHDVRMFLYLDIQNYEPRVSLSPMDISIERLDNHTYQVECNFTVPSLGGASGNVSTSINE